MPLIALAVLKGRSFSCAVASALFCDHEPTAVGDGPAFSWFLSKLYDRLRYGSFLRQREQTAK